MSAPANIETRFQSFTYDISADGTVVVPFVISSNTAGLAPDQFAHIIRLAGMGATNTYFMEGSLDGANWFKLEDLGTAGDLTGAEEYVLKSQDWFSDQAGLTLSYLRVNGNNLAADPGDVTIEVYSQRKPTYLDRY